MDDNAQETPDPDEVRAAAVLNGRRRGSRQAALDLLVARAAEPIEWAVGEAHRKRKRTGIDVDDLRQEAALAVVTAAASWDPQRYPSWQAYAAQAAKRQVSRLLDRDDLGRGLTRTTARMLRYARGLRLSAEERGEHLSSGELMDQLTASVGGESHDLEAARRSGELASLRRDLPTLISDHGHVRLDADLNDGTTTLAEVIARPEWSDLDICMVVEAMRELIDPDDMAALINKEGRLDGARRRVGRILTAPHLQWAMLGPEPRQMAALRTVSRPASS